MHVSLGLCTVATKSASSLRRCREQSHHDEEEKGGEDSCLRLPRDHASN